MTTCLWLPGALRNHDWPATRRLIALMWWVGLQGVVRHQAKCRGLRRCARFRPHHAEQGLGLPKWTLTALDVRRGTGPFLVKGDCEGWRNFSNKRSGNGRFEADFKGDQNSLEVTRFEAKGGSLAVSAIGTINLKKEHVSGLARGNLAGIPGLVTSPLIRLLEMEVELFHLTQNPPSP